MLWQSEDASKQASGCSSVQGEKSEETHEDCVRKAERTAVRGIKREVIIIVSAKGRNREDAEGIKTRQVW